MKVLFVCMGNICRSPTAEGVFRRALQAHGLADAVVVDSAGTHAYHVGEPPDARASAAALRRGIDLSSIRARRVDPRDFEHFDYVLAMDNENLAHLTEICPPHLAHKVRLFLEFANELAVQDVPDPYYGGAAGFERVLDLVEAATAGLMAELRARLRTPNP